MSTKQHVVIKLLNSLVNGENIPAIERKLSEYSLANGYAMLLLSILSNENGNGNINDLIRHQSGILLKNFVQKNWENNDRIEAVEKNSLKLNILNKSLLADKNTTIRKTTAMIISALAEYEYPERWGNLLESITAYINESVMQQNTHLLAGSIHTLLEFTPHICDLQIPSVAPVLFPLLFHILRLNPYVSIQINALQIYHNLLNLTFEMRIIHKQLCKDLIHPTMPKYLKFINDCILSRKGTLSTEVIELQTLSLAILTDICKSAPHSIVEHLPPLLQQTWQLMLHYSTSNANANVFLFYDTAFEWLFTILKHKRKEIRSSLEDKLNDISSLIVALLDANPTQCSDENEFILAECHSKHNSCLDSLMRDVIVSILEIRPRTAYQSLLACATKKSKSDRTEGSQKSSVLLIFGYLAQYMVSDEINKIKSIKIEQFLKEILWKDLHNKSDSLLQFRALWTLSKFLSHLNIGAIDSILPSICQCLTANNALCIRYISFQCLENICVVYHSNHKSIRKSVLEQALTLLCDLFSLMDAATLKYLLKTACAIVKHCTGLQLVNAMPLRSIIALWHKHCLNEDISHHIIPLMKLYIVSSDDCNHNTAHIIETLAQILTDDTDDTVVRQTSLSLLHACIKSDPKNIVFYKKFLPIIVQSLTESHSHSHICLKILCLLINSNAAYIIDGNHTKAICAIISKYLSWADPPHGIGSLICQLVINLKKSPQLTDSMFTGLLLAVIDKMSQCTTLTLRNELLLIFPKLINCYGQKQMIQFLHSQHRLGPVLQLWCEAHNDFIYPYYKKSSAVALSEILMDASNHSLLSQLSFNGDPIININAPRAMRSAHTNAQKFQFTRVPFIVKVFQILISTFRDLVVSVSENENENETDEYSTVSEESDSESDGSEYNPEQDSDGDSESESESESESASEYKKQTTQTQTQLLLERNNKPKQSVIGWKNEMDQSENRPLVVNDSIFYMDFEQWSKELIQKISFENSKAFQSVISMLNDEDRLVLKSFFD